MLGYGKEDQPHSKKPRGRKGGRKDVGIPHRINIADYKTGELARMTREEVGEPLTTTARELHTSKTILSRFERGWQKGSKKLVTLYEKRFDLNEGDLIGSDGTTQERGRP